jgi:predicted HTH transcriptional regulator
MGRQVFRESDLPEAGTSSEREDLDFKRVVDPQDSIEIAKDVAALANTVGGVILVGAQSSAATAAM